MITEFILTAALEGFTILFSVFPNFPSMPSIIADAWDWFLGASNAGAGIIVYLISQPLYYATIALIIFMVTFEYIYHFAIRFLIFRIFMGFVGR